MFALTFSDFNIVSVLIASFKSESMYSLGIQNYHIFMGIKIINDDLFALTWLSSQQLVNAGRAEFIDEGVLDVSVFNDFNYEIRNQFACKYPEMFNDVGGLASGYVVFPMSRIPPFMV